MGFMTNTATITIQKSGMSFAAGHFTIFSSSEREALHGHSYEIALELTFQVKKNGLNFDYRIYKHKLIELCKSLDQRFLLPTHAIHMTLETTEDYYIAHFNGEKIPFLKKDVMLLPISNTTLEELSRWFLDQLLLDKQELAQYDIQRLTLKVFSGEAQSGASQWIRGDNHS